MVFGDSLIDWYTDNKRLLPWRNTKDAFRIWLSEIILQQTRVAQGLAYYESFISTFPTVADLANAPEEQVMKLWQGLGYYSRARNLHYAAKQIMESYGGAFPNTYTEIKALKGVGDYTAAAIASFAFDLPHAVVDGNVYRVLSRVFDIDTPIDSTTGKKEFSQLANSLLPNERAAIFNQAIMEFGALQCTPKLPGCDNCCLEELCLAKEKGTIASRPVKVKKIKQRVRYFSYVIPTIKGDTLLEKRESSKDIWQHLFQFPLIESESELLADELPNEIKALGIVTDDFEIEKVSIVRKHILSHQKLMTQFVEVTAQGWSKQLPSHYELVANERIGEYAIPRLIDLYLEED